MGSGNFNMQNRVGAELGGGDPSMKPSGNDKWLVLLLVALVVAIVVGIIIFA